MDLDADGLTLRAGALDAPSLAKLEAIAALGRPGRRLVREPLVGELANGLLSRLVASTLGRPFRPVRAVLFDKTPEANWAVAWHQDRTIAVASKHEAPGFGPWSVKDGALHVEPPFSVLERMVTLRAHLDDCGPDNAPLLVARGSHRLGRVRASEAAVRAAEAEVVACPARAGDVWLYRTPILHASERALRPSRRRVLQIDFAGADLPHGLQWAEI